ncbi:MAG TPA: hypothetical protein VHJ34_05185 [Actinomycetota bacterium]|nr:hypothetical protein [Actinomycetota bacterium]
MSYVVLWTMTAATLIVLLVVLRQLGLIYLRARSAAFDLDEGPLIGSVVAFDEVDDRGNEFSFPNADAELNVLVFASPHCALCKESLGGLRGALKGREASVVVVSEGDAESNAGLRAIARDATHFVTSLKRQRALRIETIPYALVTTGTGVVVAKGIVNYVEDLETLLDDALEKAGPRSVPVVTDAP